MLPAIASLNQQYFHHEENTPPTPLRTLWRNAAATELRIINQTLLPHRLQIETLTDCEAVYWAIRNMTLRGAPLIGAAAAYGLYFAACEAQQQADGAQYFAQAVERLRDSRPTAVNLFWAIDRCLNAITKGNNWQEKSLLALAEADAIVADDIETCRLIGVHGLPILQAAAQRKAPNQPLNILTHCNAGMLGCIQWGTITSPIYQAKALGIDLHVWVDETRPRNQGANLTAWELTQHNIPHTLITDNTGALLMQRGMVDLVLVGTDRTTRRGDVANKIGTYLKATAAADNNVPFYVALPSTSIDWTISDGITEIPIEERSADEVRYVHGLSRTSQQLDSVLICPASTPALNYGFDITPARLITGGFITERGCCAANEQALKSLFA